MHGGPAIFHQHLPQEISRKGLGVVSDECCPFNTNMERKGGRIPPTHNLVYSHRNGRNGEQMSCDWRFQQLVTQSPNNPLKHIFALFVRQPGFYHFHCSFASSASHLYWPKLMYFIIFNLAYSNFLNISSMWKVFLDHFELPLYWFFFLFLNYPMIIVGW